MIIIHSHYQKKSSTFLEKYRKKATLVIDWFSSDSLVEKAVMEIDRCILPRSFPSVVSDTLPVIIEPKTDDPESELLTAEHNFLAQQISSYGSVGYDTSWSELVSKGVISIENARYQVVTAIKREAQRRILKVWGKTDLLECVVKQSNQERVDKAAGTTDERFARTDAIREASNNFEIALADMEKEELAELVVSEWDGWPELTKHGEE